MERLPYAFLDEVMPHMKRDMGPLLGPKVPNFNALDGKDPEKDFSTEFPPESVGKALQFGLNQGRPIADRAFFMHQNHMPKDSKHPVMVPAGYRNNRYKFYNSAMHRRKPFYRKNRTNHHRRTGRNTKHKYFRKARDGKMKHAHMKRRRGERFSTEGMPAKAVSYVGRDVGDMWQFLTHVALGVVLIIVFHSIISNRR